MELECRVVAIVDRDAKDIGWQQVAGELHAAEFQPQHLRQRVGEGGFAHARQIFDQQVAARQEAGESELELGFLAEDDLAGMRVYLLYGVLRVHACCRISG